MLLLVNRKVDQYQNPKIPIVDLEIFLHYPQQLLRSFHKPIFKSKIKSPKETWQVDFWKKLLKITISKVTVLRKRSGSNLPCDEHLKNDDGKFAQQVITVIKCVPPYWRQFGGVNSSFTICNSIADLRKAYLMIRNYKTVLRSYVSPCTQMEIFAKFDREENNEWNDPRIKFLYDESDYEEMTNTQSFDFESFVSGVGGFIGIFLGYSILQIPDLLELLPSFNCNLRQNIKKGKISYEKN